MREPGEKAGCGRVCAQKHFFALIFYGPPRGYFFAVRRRGQEKSRIPGSFKLATALEFDAFLDLIH